MLKQALTANCQQTLKSDEKTKLGSNLTESYRPPKTYFGSQSPYGASYSFSEPTVPILSTIDSSEELIAEAKHTGDYDEYLLLLVNGVRNNFTGDHFQPNLFGFPDTLTIEENTVGRLLKKTN